MRKYDTLSDAEKEAIDASSDLVQEKAASILRDVRQQERAARQATADLDYKVAMLSIGQRFSTMQAKYQEYPGVLQYLEAVQEDMLEHVNDFIEPEEEPEDNNLSALLPALNKKNPADLADHYRVNLIVDNSNLAGAPVVVASTQPYI